MQKDERFKNEVEFFEIAYNLIAKTNLSAKNLNFEDKVSKLQHLNRVCKQQQLLKFYTQLLNYKLRNTAPNQDPK